MVDDEDYDAAPAEGGGFDDACTDKVKAPSKGSAPSAQASGKHSEIPPQGSGSGASGPGGIGGGPTKLLMAVRSYGDTQILTPSMFASLAVRWLQFITLWVKKKFVRLNHMARRGLDPTTRKVLVALKDSATVTPGLESYAELMAKAFRGSDGPASLAESIHKLLKTLQGLYFEVQICFFKHFAEHVLPFGNDIMQVWLGDEGNCGSTVPAARQDHVNVKCAGCAYPLVGPRFKYTSQSPECSDYDLCGNCYAKFKKELHKDCPADWSDFKCILFPNTGPGC